ncbi:DNA polymerase III subunit tau [Marinomonas spartinae]|uniref:DNA polymerase III subunit gamma/tau n=1 Tax=Marinomonas spartinae TaxID=1792290 RepID=UPI000808DC7F|nr:DNA polymerase III subunit gamma/tau [Marinomonas spartinae]SBS34511.1 DNA polymerase III subunit tau [Marinomonas spartinae]
MSYQVLARKWRPQTFLEMAGQDHVLQALVNALRQQRLHHAYLFSGTRGVGKTTIARIFAKCLNCETHGISPEPCGTCDSCVEIAEGRFVDLIEVDAASRTKVEDTRELLENVQYAPTRGRFKVYLIDEVHMLSTHSFNALLKTLEEPPPHVKFLLATTDPQKLPVTILSRCLQFNLKNMSPQRVVDYLQTVLNSEQVSFDMPALWQIGQAANGSMRDALSLTDQAIAFGNGTITETGVTAMLGLVNQSQVMDLLESVAAKNAADVLQRVELLADYQPDFSAICGSLLDVLHRVAIEQQVPGALLDQLGDLARIQHIAATVSAEEIQMMYQSLLIGRRDLHLAHTARSGFEMLMLRLIAFRPAPPMRVSHAAPPQSYQTEGQPTAVADGPTQAHSSVSPEAELSEQSTVQTEDRAELTGNSPELTEDRFESARDDAELSNPIRESVPESERPPWEDSPELGPMVPQASQDDEVSPLSAADNTTNERAQIKIDSSSEPVTEPEQESRTDESQPQDVIPPSSKHIEAVVEKVKAAAIEEDEDDEEDEEEAEERAIADVSDPFNPAADLVEALGHSDSDEPSTEEASAPEEVEANVPAHRKQDTVSQPALGMPLPEIAHYQDLTMELWWLVAPRLPLTGLVQNILMNSSLVDASEQGVRLEVPLEYGHMLNQTRYEQIQGALSDFFSLHVPLIIDTVEDTRGVTAEEFAASKRAEALQVAIDHLNSHPVVQALSQTMGAQLIYDTVKVKA